MRGKLICTHGYHALQGITPACAGKTSLFRKFPQAFKDHPRVCGENLLRRRTCLLYLGSPPRVRGKHYLPRLCAFPGGITPACAGKTNSFKLNKRRPQDHPRVCGENMSLFMDWMFIWGSPPRVRGKLRCRHSITANFRITPACAGKTKRQRSR